MARSAGPEENLAAQTSCADVRRFDQQIKRTMFSVHTPEQSSLVEPHVGLNSLQRIFVHEKRSFNRAIISPKPNSAPGCIVGAALIGKANRHRPGPVSTPPRSLHGSRSTSATIRGTAARSQRARRNQLLAP